MVGAVVVQNGLIVGEGFHKYAELKHAEVLAIDRAGDAARGATLYLNLEPCSHRGRTPPCCDLIIDSGIVRVVVAITDPNPLVSGKGIRSLKAAGVEVSVGLLEAEAQKLNEAFATYITAHRPFVTLKAGMTLDGKIADSRGRSKWISSEGSRQRVQQLRFESDAVLVGIGTILKDDPSLTDRSGHVRRRSLVRVVLDSRLRLPLSSQLIRSSGLDDIIVFCSEQRDVERERALRKAGVDIIPAPASGEKVPFDFVLEELGRRQIMSLLIEGGAEVNFEALQSRLVDKVLFFVAPKILGGLSSLPVFGGVGFSELEQSVPLQFASVENVGPDLMIEAYVRRAGV
jgi:diaminohydroxyphosphoribosylaminopyrimidine deaminase/5-amino-6-(5-phosphoribosylamino)uracil reductase